ncbi:MAG: hypothetical protein AAGA23_04440 [Pseudomonadota bacterium]
MKRILALLTVSALLALGWMMLSERNATEQKAEPVDLASPPPLVGGPEEGESIAAVERPDRMAAKARPDVGQDSLDLPIAETEAGAGAGLAPDVSPDSWRRALRDEVRAATVQDYERHRARGGRNDAQAAFWLHVFYYECRRAPRKEWQLDQRLAAVRRRFDEAGDAGIAEHRDEQINLLLRSYERCAEIGPEVDAYLASLEWLQQAADLGHLGAQRLYHYYARMLIAQDQSDLVFQRPELIREFQLRADRYAQALLERDHPQGLLLMARMLNVGDVYPKDNVMAYAYARVAETEFSGELKADAEQRLAWIRRSLAPDQVLEAEEKALALAAARAAAD